MSSQDISYTKPNVANEKSSTQNDENFNETKDAESVDSTNMPNSEAEESSAAFKSQKLTKCRKNDQCIQQALRCLSRLSTPEEKFSAICAKYADIFDENRKLQSSLKEYQKQLPVLTKEKDQMRSELMKVIFTKDKLENLCRELQRQNREIKDESLQKIRDEEQKRKEVSTKFQATLNEITELMKQDNDKTMKLRDDNIDMTSKLKSICEQYEIREQQIEKMAKQMALESQLYEAKIAKLEMETAAEKEMLLREKQQLLLTLTEYQARFQEYQNIELTLRNQVALYNDKYEEFEKSLTRSNDLFGGFKREMEIMSNKIVKLESETAAWKSRWEKTQKALIEMASEKQKSDQEIVLAAKQMATLHKLCRTLQSERTQLLAKLKHDSSQNLDSNLVTDVNSLLESNLNEDNVVISKNDSQKKHPNNKSKARAKSSSDLAQSSPTPKTRSKIDEENSNVSKTPENVEIVGKEIGVESLVSEMNLCLNLEEENHNNDSAFISATSAENSTPVSASEIISDNDKENNVDTKNLEGQKESLSLCNNDSSLSKCVPSEPETETTTVITTNSDIANDRQKNTATKNENESNFVDGILPQNILISSTLKMEMDNSSEFPLNAEESVNKAHKLNSKKKMSQKKKNKK